MSELDIIRRIRARSRKENSAIQLGIGDDCALLRPDTKFDLVFTTDLTIENRHFTHRTHKASEVGHLALARSLSDLAAMGSEPVFCLVALAVPAQLARRWLNDFYKGLLRLADSHKITLAGGDLSKADAVIADVMCCGRVPRGKALLRSGAKPGDGIFVTGRLGKRKHLPKPRLAEGIALRGVASAAMDLSDGLSLDLHRLCLESGVAAELDSSQIPVARGSTLEKALHYGEDYELLFTAPAVNAKGTRIGVITKGKLGQVRLDRRILKPEGWDHFR
ncbi:MAG TPA: thiamine-monophosphate kinase [Bryobacteraceae bacterium]|jgi:thiamine-monophosphate kinase|nr:thiamine-monophosphate kinase [Bryobacteraceae bacterium]